MSKKFIAIIVFQFCALPYVIFAPFEPVSFFSIGVIAIVGLAWCVVWLVRDRKSQKRLKDSQ